MRIWRILVLVVAPLLLAPTLAGTVAARLPVVVFDGPAESSSPRYLLGKGYPVVVISETSTWLKVCLHDRSTGYLHRRDVVPGNNVMTIRPAALRADPSPAGAILLQSAKNLLLTSTGEPIRGWLPVRHVSGSAGFIQLQDVWGYSGC